MADYRCATCKGQVQATREEYLSLDERGMFTLPDGALENFPIYRFYCESDVCWEYNAGGAVELVNPEDILPTLLELNLIEVGVPA